jgi:hypothetical protein
MGHWFQPTPLILLKSHFETKVRGRWRDRERRRDRYGEVRHIKREREEKIDENYSKKETYLERERERETMIMNMEGET